MSLIITNKNTLGSAALITISNANNNLTSTTNGDLTIISSGDQVVGLNVQNYEKYFTAQEGAHTINKEQLEAIAKLGYEIKNPESRYIVGEIVDKQPHPKSDKLAVLKVNVGEELTIVTNLPDAKVGIKVVVAMVGATHTTGYAIKASKMVGVQSTGVICSGDTLGVKGQKEILIPNGNVGDKFIL